MLSLSSRAISVPAGKEPIRILGPCRSPRMAIGLPVSDCVRRTESAASDQEFSSPWEKLIRATSRPALTSWRTVSGSLEAGPRVATILARRLDVISRESSMWPQVSLWRYPSKHYCQRVSSASVVPVPACERGSACPGEHTTGRQEASETLPSETGQGPLQPSAAPPR